MINGVGLMCETLKLVPPDSTSRLMLLADDVGERGFGGWTGNSTPGARIKSDLK